MSESFPDIPTYTELSVGDDHLKETQINSKEVYRGYYLKLIQDRVLLPDGKEAGREYLIHPGAVAIIPLLPDGRILLERQYRYPLHQSFIEIPAGKLDVGEDSLTCAKRELEEETGFIAKEWVFLGKIHPIISHSTEFIDIYLAKDLTFTRQHLDEGEFLDIFGAELKEIETLIKESLITDVKTIIGTYWIKDYLNQSVA
jgi:ADP-ribose pyrophosphatase